MRAGPNLLDFVIRTHRDIHLYDQITIFQTFSEIRKLFESYKYTLLIADFLTQSILFYYFHFYCLGLLTKMLANLPVEIILLICQYPEFKDLGQLAWTNKRMMQIIKRYLPKKLKKIILFYRRKIFLVWAKINFSI